MLARAVRSLRSRPGRTAALGLVVLLALGAVVAAVSGGDVAVHNDEAGAGRELTARSGTGGESGAALSEESPQDSAGAAYNYGA
ncbi:MAG: hypothetical protein ACRD0C_18195, partial [Acidimicrobiia bacterium]